MTRELNLYLETLLQASVAEAKLQRIRELVKGRHSLDDRLFTVLVSILES